MEKVIISVDSGGSKTKVCLINDKKEILDTVLEGSGSPAVIGPKLAMENIYRAITKIIIANKNCKVDYIVIGMSGLMSITNDKDFIDQLKEDFKTNIILVSDASFALYSVIKDVHDEGVLVLSGTGAAVVGFKNEQTHLISGWGHLLTEAGSAYSVVRTLVVNTIRTYENTGIITKLGQKFIDHLGINAIEEFRIFIYSNSKREIASYASFVNEQAMNKNQEAIELLKSEGRILANDVRNAYRVANLTPNAVLGFRGGFIVNVEILREELISSLKEMGIVINILKDDDPDPIYGGYYLAKRQGW